MDFTNHLANAQHTVNEQWPVYVIGIGGGTILALVVIISSMVQGWYSFVTLALVALMILWYLFVASLWAAGYIWDPIAIREIVFKIGRLQPTDHVVYLSLGRWYLPATFCRRLTSGRVTTIDLYNPQLTPNRGLARIRQQGRPAADPRLIWRDGNLNLLPLPDDSVNSIVMIYVAAEFWQRGDQDKLLAEAHRILIPGGRLLFVERIRSTTSTLTNGFFSSRLNPPAYWEKSIQSAHFEIKKREDIHDLVLCLRADKPDPNILQQLPLDI